MTVKTINENFDMNIKDYITVNFFALEKIVDTVGGVEIDVKDYEIKELNEEINELNKGDSNNQVTEVGVHTLNGVPALGYTRIRYSGEGDYERTLRQRIVLKKVINKVLNTRSLSQTLELIEILSPFVQTSLDKSELVGLATTIFASEYSNHGRHKINF